MFLERYAAEYEARGRLRTLRRAHLLALGIKLGLGLVASAVLLALHAVARALLRRCPSCACCVPVLTRDGGLRRALDHRPRHALRHCSSFRWVALLAVLFHVAKTVMVGLLWWAQPRTRRAGHRALGADRGAGAGVRPRCRCGSCGAPGTASRRRPSAPGAALLRSMFSYCVPLLGARITFMSGQNLSKIVLGKLFDAAAAGLLHVRLPDHRALRRAGEHAAARRCCPRSPTWSRAGSASGCAWSSTRRSGSSRSLACALSFGLFVFARELTLLVGSPLFEPAIPHAARAGPGADRAHRPAAAHHAVPGDAAAGHRAGARAGQVRDRVRLPTSCWCSPLGVIGRGLGEPGRRGGVLRRGAGAAGAAAARGRGGARAHRRSPRWRCCCRCWPSPCWSSGASAACLGSLVHVALVLPLAVVGACSRSGWCAARISTSWRTLPLRAALDARGARQPAGRARRLRPAGRVRRTA